MLPLNKERVTGTIAMGISISIVTAFVLFIGAFFAPILNNTMVRTQQVIATVAYAEPGGLGMVIKYNFLWNDHVYSGEANCATCLNEYNQAKKGTIFIWIDPQDPNNSSLEKEDAWVYFLRFLWFGILLFLGGFYGFYLFFLWKKPKQE